MKENQNPLYEGDHQFESWLWEKYSLNLHRTDVGQKIKEQWYQRYLEITKNKK